MRIVMVAPFGMRPKMTVRVRALRLGQALVARGHQVWLLVPPWDDRAASGKRAEQEGVQLWQMPLPPTPLLDVPVLSARLLHSARALQPDILHTFKPKAYSGFVALAWHALQRAGRVTAPLVVDSDDWEGAGGWNDHAPYSPLQKRLFAWQEGWGMGHAAGVTVASRTLQSIGWSMGVPPERLLYLPNGPGALWPTPEPGKVTALRAALDLDGAPVALLFTRFVEFSVEEMARRWAAIVARVPAARLLVVGAGLAGEEHHFRGALEKLGIAETVRAVGWLPFDRLAVHFALARVALYPMADTLLNRAKCPVKLADYLQAGLPVVGEAVGQVREYLMPGAGGVLVPPGDDEAFVAATCHLLRAPEEGAVLGQAGQVRLHEHFGWPVQAARAEALYEALRRRPDC